MLNKFSAVSIVGGSPGLNILNTSNRIVYSILDKIKKRANEKGVTILEALVSTAIIGIGFVAVFQMVNYSVQSIDTSGERTKANYLLSMMAEDVIGHKNSIYGIDSMVDKVAISIDGTVSVNNTVSTTARKFSDHLYSTEYFSGR